MARWPVPRLSTISLKRDRFISLFISFHFRSDQTMIDWWLPSKLITTLNLQFYHHQIYLPLPKNPFFPFAAGLSALTAVLEAGCVSLRFGKLAVIFTGVGSFGFGGLGLLLVDWWLLPNAGGFPMGPEGLIFAILVPRLTLVGQHW